MADLGSLLVGSIGSLVVAAAGVRFAEGTRVRGQVWDRKALAYSDILETFAEVTGALEDLEFSDDETDPEVKAQYTARIVAADKRLDVVVYRHRWLLPDRFDEISSEMTAALVAMPDSLTLAEKQAALLEVLSTCTREISDLAKSDLAYQGFLASVRSALRR